MEGQRFDRLTRSFATRPSRRGMLGFLVSGSVAAIVGGLGRVAPPSDALAQDATPTRPSIRIGPTATPAPLPTRPSIRIATPPPVGIVGTTYVDPKYGWSVHWDSSWQTQLAGSGVVVYRDRDDPHEGVSVYSLDSETAVDWFTPERLTNPSSCLMFNETESTRRPRAAVDGTGAPLEGEGAGSAWAVYTFTSEGAGGSPVEYGWYSECRVLVPNSALLRADIRIPLARFNEQLEEYFAVLDTVTVPQPGTWRPVATATPTPQPTPTPRPTTCDPAGVGGIGWPCDSASDCCGRYCCCQLSTVGFSAACHLCDFCA